MATCVGLSHHMKFTLAAAAATNHLCPICLLPVKTNFFREKLSTLKFIDSGSSRHHLWFLPREKTPHPENLVFFVLMDAWSIVTPSEHLLLFMCMTRDLLVTAKFCVNVLCSTICTTHNILFIVSTSCEDFKLCTSVWFLEQFSSEN